MSTPLLENILNQAEALRTVSRYQYGEGMQALAQVAQILRSRKRIVLTGMGASLFACVPLQHMLAEQHFDVTCVETAELLYFPPTFLGPETVVVMVSRSGESIEVIKLLQSVRELGCPVIGVVNVADSTLARHSHGFLLLGSPADQLVAIQTYTATLVVLALLAAAISGELDLGRAELATSIEILGNSIPRWVRDREELRPFLEDDRPLYLLGRGQAMGAVSEGVLLMHEVAKVAAVGMSVPQFRHGPVETVDARFRAVVIGTQTQTTALDSAFANDVTRLGGQVRWLGPSLKNITAPDLCPWPLEVPWRFVSLVETIPLQIAAYTKAELCGVRPGDFRWAPLITNSETGFAGGV